MNDVTDANGSWASQLVARSSARWAAGGNGRPSARIGELHERVLIGARVCLADGSEAGDAEIEKLGEAPAVARHLGQEHRVGAQPSVHDAGGVRRGQRRRDAAQDRREVSRGHRTDLHRLLERSPAKALHHDIRRFVGEPARGMHLDDVRVTQTRHGRRLPCEVGEHLSRQPRGPREALDLPSFLNRRGG